MFFKWVKHFLLPFLLIGFTNGLTAGNNCPIILVHGFLGWGTDEMNGYQYWGGHHNLAGYLDSLGYDVRIASIGPLSSNWDRAVELYYCIKGGQVDYGEMHSGRYSLERKPEGRVYPGLYPEWNQEHPVHLIGHSLGGQTVRMLQFLLANDFYLDTGFSVPEESFLLGQVHTGWIKSITTVSTPHNGTTLTNILTKNMPFLQDLIGVAAVTGSDFYNFDLDQWNFKKEPEEKWLDYFQRVRESSLWETRNTSVWDLSLDGSRDLNTGLMADPDIYYFSYATYSTHLDSATGYHVPDKGISLVYHGNARILGYKTAYWSNGQSTNSTWYENDGLVNTISMIAPGSGLNGPDPVAEYHENELLLPGQWYFMGKYNFDHKQGVGHSLNKKRTWETVREIYRKQCEILYKLPQ